MSIEHSLAEIISTTAATTASGELPISMYAGAMAQSALLAGLGVVIFMMTYGRGRLEWSESRTVPTPASDRGQPGSQSAGALWIGAAAMVWVFLAVPALLFAMLSGVAATRSAGVDGTLVAITSVTYACGLLVAMLLHAALGNSGSGRMLGLVPLVPLAAAGKAIVAAMIAVPLTYFVAAGSMLLWQLVRYRHEASHAMLQLMERNESSPWVLGITIVNATLLAPLFEEVLFRGHLQTALTMAMPRSRWPAIVITSLLFAGMHDAWTMPAMFVLSVAIGMAYEWSGSLWVAIAIHVAFNATSTLSFLKTDG